MTLLRAPRSNPLKAPLSLLFPAAVFAGFGLGSWALTASLPAPVPPTLTLPARLGSNAPQPAQTRPDALPIDQQARGWPALFGSPAPPVPAPEPEPAPPPLVADPFTAPIETPAAPLFSDYILRGLVVQDQGGWAMIEGLDGVGLFRPGETLPGGETLLAIHPDSVEIGLDGARETIGFDDQPAGASPPDSFDAPFPDPGQPGDPVPNPQFGGPWR